MISPTNFSRGLPERAIFHQLRPKGLEVPKAGRTSKHVWSLCVWSPTQSQPLSLFRAMPNPLTVKWTRTQPQHLWVFLPHKTKREGRKDGGSKPVADFVAAPSPPKNQREGGVWEPKIPDLNFYREPKPAVHRKSRLPNVDSSQSWPSVSAGEWARCPRPRLCSRDEKHSAASISITVGPTKNSPKKKKKQSVGLKNKQRGSGAGKNK